ncbi:MAG: M20/M25/M40 family metallo-hydrolase [Pirellulales bacterium]
MSKHSFHVSCLATMPVLALLSASAAAAENTNDIEQRLAAAVRYLASDELEGRGLTTGGLEKAADYIADRFVEIGLQTKLINGGPFQHFKVTTNSKLGDAAENVLAIVSRATDGKGKADAADNGWTLELGKDFSTLAAGGSGKFDLPLVFAGYGISAKEAHYDDYAGIDVKGKCVIVLRHQPFRGKPHSPFSDDPSRHAFFESKISNAYAHGAAAVIFCTGKFELDNSIQQQQKTWQAVVDALSEANTNFKKIEKPTAKQTVAHRRSVMQWVAQIQKSAERLRNDQDQVLEFHRAGSGGPSRRTPVVHCRRLVINQLLKAALNTDLAAREEKIDTTGKPQSQEIVDWRAVGQTSVIREQQAVKNVVAVLKGRGPRADETVVIGAHYDHLGFGGAASAQPGSKDIHNGADDNGSGIAVMLEIARRLVALEKPLQRRVVFIAFTGEEAGLLGSAHYVKEPTVPLDKIVAMLNLDMVGRLKDNKLIVHGTGTADEFDPLINRLNAQHAFKIVKKPSGFGPSDHTSFYSKKIPVLHFFTGGHEDYHKPSDDYEKLNVAGMRRIGSLVSEVALTIADADGRPKYLETKQTRVAGGRWPYFGSRPDYGYDKPGIRMDGVTPGSPAARGGIKAGDVIVKFGKAEIATVTDFANVLSKHKAGDKVPIVVRRDGKELTVVVVLDPPRK